MPAGRPRIEVNWEDVDKLCAIQCTEEEIAQFLRISVDTLALRCQEDHGMNFPEYFAQKRGVGKVSLRRSQWKLAQEGNPTMNIWLGKQYLGQSDKQSTYLSGPDGKPIETQLHRKMSDEELQAEIARHLAEMKESGAV